MAYEGYKDEAKDILIESNTTGLTDIQMEVIAPSATSSTVNASEIGTSKIYKATVSPSETGTYALKIISPTDTSIDGKIKSLRVTDLSREDLGGSGYDSALHSQKILSDKLDTAIANQTGLKGGFVD